MKQFRCVIGVLLMLCMVVSSFGNVSATGATSETMSSQPIRIQKTDFDAILPNTRTLTEEETTEAIELIDELALNKQMNNNPILRNNSAEVATRTTRIETIEGELKQLGVFPLTIREIYQLHGMEYRSGPPDVPNDTNYVNFFGITTSIISGGTRYKVFSIVGYSSGASQSNIYVPMYKTDEVSLYDQDYYASNNLNQVLDVVSTLGSLIFKDAFEKVPILNYLSTLWDISTYFNKTGKQAVTVEYEAQQTFVYSYVAEESVGYYEHMQTGERIAGYFTVKFTKYTGATPTVKDYDVIHWEATSPYYSDYSHAVKLYRDNALQVGYRVGNIQFKLDNIVAHNITMTYFNTIWNIPGV